MDGPKLPTYSGAIHPDMQRERDSASFQRDEMTLLLYDGSEALERKRYIGNYVILSRIPHLYQACARHRLPGPLGPRRCLVAVA